jgi:hypothetical protein
MQYFVFEAKSAVGFMVAVPPANEIWLSFPAIVANVAAQLLPDLMVTLPLPPATLSSNVMVGDAVVDTSVADVDGVQLVLAGPVVSIEMVSALDEAEVLPTRSE